LALNEAAGYAWGGQGMPEAAKRSGKNKIKDSIGIMDNDWSDKGTRRGAQGTRKLEAHSSKQE
jgi:hypothetical protein